MRKSFGLVLVGAALLAAVVAIVAIVMPAQRDQQRKAHVKSAQHALALLRFPAGFIAQDDRGKRIQICVDTPLQRCFVAAGDPADNVAAVKAALAPFTSGPTSSACQTSNPLPRSPVSCSLKASVRGGGTLVVELFARPVDSERPVAARTYSGSYVEVHVG